MPRLNCTYREFLEIIKAYGFELHRHDGGSHQRWRREDRDAIFYVDFAPHSMSDDVPLGTLDAMIRQSGLSKKLFRK